MAAHVAVVRDVGVRHEQTAVSDRRDAMLVVLSGHRTGAYGHVLADEIVVANRASAEKPCLVFEILRQYAHLGAAENVVVFADNRPPLDDTMGSDDRTTPDAHMRSDNRKGLDLNTLGQLGLGVHNGAWMYFHLNTLERNTKTK
jgi:hypothetical protein